MQGAGDSHVSQAMFIMTEATTMSKVDCHSIRVANSTVMPPPLDDIPTEAASVSDVTTSAQDVREVLLEMMEQKILGEASLTVDRLCACWIRGRRRLISDHFINCSAVLRTRGEQDLKWLTATFADGPTYSCVPMLVPMVEVETVALAPKKRFPRLVERRESWVKAAAGGGSGSGEDGPRGIGNLVSGRGAQVFVYLPKQIT